ncbi:MAG TPA: YbaB/EbfC family nucleoid-associated protein, partial [Alphaproteobacteria bacterium]|nr:YbaB/EbfC family nucleoid-associated protein [Alphaproteobacteria bacterium]
SLFKQEEKEIVEDLICAACNDAKNKVEQHVSQEMSKITGGLQLPPGFKMPF